MSHGAYYERIPGGETRESLALNEVKTDLNTHREKITADEFNAFKQLVVNNKLNEKKRASLYNHIDETSQKPILLLACRGQGEFENVTADTIKRLIEGGAKVDFIDQNWYGWEAIHYAASASNPEKLKVICEFLGPTRINTLTKLSENALHVLLAHGVLLRSYQVSCQNGLNLRESRIINKEQQCVVECAEILIQNGLDVNHNNFWNETPLLVAIKRKYFGVIRLLLEQERIDLDYCKDAISGKTAREFLKGRPDFELLPKNSVPPPKEKQLFQLLKSGDEESFLKAYGGKIQDSANAIDGDNKENSSCTLLQYCFRRGLIAWHNQKGNYECDFQVHYQDITANRLVQVFCQSGMAKCIQHLIDNGAKIDFSLAKFENGKTLLEAAIIRSYYPFVALILGRNFYKLSEEKIGDFCSSLEELLKSGSSETDVNNTLSVVLNWLLRLDKPFDFSQLMPVLEHGVRIINKENMLLLLKFSGSLCSISEKKKIKLESCFPCCRNVENKNILEEIDPEILQTHLDECVEHSNGTLHINYNSFITKNNNSKNDSVQHSVRHVLDTFVSSSRLQNFLDHLVFKILILRKWEQLRLRLSDYISIKYFYLNLFFYILFYILLNVFILMKFNSFIPYITDVFQGLVIFFWVIFTLKELFQFVANPYRYLCAKNNYAELFFIIVTILVCCMNNKYSDIPAVLSVLSSNLVLLLLLEQVPKFAKYIIILRTIVFYLRYIAFYFIQFLAFAICFYILFSTSDQKIWVDLPNKIFETIILFTGNLDYMETPWKKDSNSTVTEYHSFEYKEVVSKIVLILFVLFMAVILNNLLLGLLVTDMEGINKSVKLIEQIKRARFVVRMEKFLKSGCMNKCAKCLPCLLIFNYEDKDNSEMIKIEESDRKILDEEEKQNLDFILAKKTKGHNTLTKLFTYIRVKINHTQIECPKDEINKNLMEKLELIERRVQNLHEMGEMIKTELNKKKS